MNIKLDATCIEVLAQLKKAAEEKGYHIEMECNSSNQYNDYDLHAYRDILEDNKVSSTGIEALIMEAYGMTVSDIKSRICELEYSLYDMVGNSIQYQEQELKFTVTMDDYNSTVGCTDLHFFFQSDVAEHKNVNGKDVYEITLQGKRTYIKGFEKPAQKPTVLGSNKINCSKDAFILFVQKVCKWLDYHIDTDLMIDLYR